LHRRLKESLQRRNSKMRNCIQPAEMLVVAVRYVIFVCALKEKFNDQNIRKRVSWEKLFVPPLFCST
jgi:hypothetical protein